MKKIIYFVFSFLLIFSINIYAFSPITVKFMSKNVGITTPDDEVIKYHKIEDIPKILYFSKIIAYGMAIVSCYDIDIILRNNQGIFITKDPISQNIIVSKVENTRTGNINIAFDAGTMGEMSPDTKIAIEYKNSQTILKVLTGSISMQSEGTEFELVTNEVYTYKTKKGLKNNAV